MRSFPLTSVLPEKNGASEISGNVASVESSQCPLENVMLALTFAHVMPLGVMVKY